MSIVGVCPTGAKSIIPGSFWASKLICVIAFASMLTPDRDALFDLLFHRATEARGKGRLEALLRAIKAEQNVPGRAFRVTGSVDELCDAVKTAADGGWLTERRLADLVDELEENGGQHIFLFNLSAQGHGRLTQQRLAQFFNEVPARPTPGVYAELPATKRTYMSARPDGIVLKQIFKAEYWEKDDEQSARHSNDEQRAVFHVRHERRAINLFVIHPETRHVEIRIDRVRGQMDDTMALEHLDAFLDDLSEAVDPVIDLAAIDVAAALNRMAEDRAEIYLNADDALDPSAQITLANRRARDKGRDIRDHEKYALGGDDVTRASLSPYWIINGDVNNKVFTHISVIPAASAPKVGICGKIYVSATVERDTLNHVIARIRHFAR